MEKFIYEKYLGFTKEKSAEELTIEHLAYSSIECSDRAFANNFEAGMSGCHLNELFENLKVIAAEDQNATAEEKEKALKSIIENLENCEDAYKSVKRGIREINNDSRVYEEISKLKKELELE